MLVTRITLSWRSTAPTTASSPATAPVCASATWRPAGLTPALSTTIGLPARSARCAARANRAGSLICSRNRQITPVASSSMRYSSTSVAPIIASLPMVARVLTPIAWACANASTTLASAPLCSAMPTGPASSGGGTVSAYGAARACAFRNPRQLGPSTVIPCAAARAIICCSSARPGSPSSR